VTIRTGARAYGRAVFRVVMSDVANSDSPSRRVEGRIVVEIQGVPDVPPAPVPGREILDSRASLDWRAPPANGSPIDYYEVRTQNGGRTQRCPTTSCDFTGLTNDTPYRFSVRAHNAVGYSGWSAFSGEYIPGKGIDLQGNVVELVDAGDGFLEIAWRPIEIKGGARATYNVRWQGGSKEKLTEPRLRVENLDNHLRYVFTVSVSNAYGVTLTSKPFQPVGIPGTPVPPTVTDQELAGSFGAVSLSWPPVDANGPMPVKYSVYRDGKLIRTCAARIFRNCDIGDIVYDGRVYQFAVMATNGGDAESPLGPPTSWRATGKPVQWGDWEVKATGQNNQAEARFTVPNSRGSLSSVRVYVDGNRVRQVQETGTVTLNFDVPDNLGPHNVFLEVCNEEDACTRSSTQPVQTWGPLNQSHIHSVKADVDVRRISWTIEVDSNGSAALLTVTSDQGRHQEFAVPIGVSTFTTDTMMFGFDTTENLTVTLSDANPDRGPVGATSSATTEPAPPAKVVGSHGAACNDDPDAGLPACDSGGGGGPRCTDASCAFVHIALSDWRTDISDPTVFCSVEHGPDRAYDPRASRDTIDFFGDPGGTVTIECFNNAGQRAETEFTW
jgi:hypothetical protein